MVRLAIIVCLVSRVIYGEHTVQRDTYSEHVYRKLRPNMPTLHGKYTYKQYDKPRTYSAIGLPPYDPHVVQAQYDTRTLEKMRHQAPTVYEEFIAPHTTPSTIKHRIDYEIARATADAKYQASKYAADDDDTLEKLKSIMQYHPPADAPRDTMSDYASSEYSMDDDDVRSSSRSLYDNWPYFYHSPYEYETNKNAHNSEKAKDKRYVMDGFDSIIPVQELIENDLPPPQYELTPNHYHETTDNPIVGDEPFFSFILNDYFEKNNAEDPVIFKGLDFGRDFDHDTYLPDVEEARRSRRIDNSYFTTNRPTTHYDVPSKVSLAESVTEQTHKRNLEFDTRKNAVTSDDKHNSEYANQATEYNGFKDFLDTFAQKFGSEDHKRNSNYIHETNKDKGENKKGFRRIYHKDEYMEDNEFYDNNNSSTRGVDKASSNAHVGGSEAYLRSQAAAATGNRTHAASNAGKANNATFNSSYNGHDRSNTLDNKFNKYIDVAKQAAQSNDEDYADHYRI